MMNVKHIARLSSIMTILMPLGLLAQKHIEGVVIDPLTKKPVSGAIISGGGLTTSVETDSLGFFRTELPNPNQLLTVWYPGFYKQEISLNGRERLRIVMRPQQTGGYTSTINVPFVGYRSESNKSTNQESRQKSEMNLAASSPEALLYGFSGVQVTQKSGMPGEGAGVKMRGNSSYIGSNSPLYVIDGVPYMPDMNESAIIGGYSKSVFNPFNSNDIEHITVLKGSEAGVYGSMGSNGVILIETDKATNMDTKVSFLGQYGFDFNKTDMPLLNVADYKTYVGELAMTQYNDMSDILTNFPYLVDDPNYYQKFLYNNNTDWQDLIYRNGFRTDNILKIKGGDAIAKYDISLGYGNVQGSVVGTAQNKFYARLNADINLHKNASMFTTLSLASVKTDLMEQGMVEETNPMLAAMKKAPLLSPYIKDADNNISPDYSTIRDADGELLVNDRISNPLAIVNTVEANEQLYDIQMNLGIRARILRDLSFVTKVGLNYTYNHEKIFVPGVTNATIMPLDGGLADNNSYNSVGKTFNMYYSGAFNYNRTFNHVHMLRATAGIQAVMTQHQLDAAGGRNSASDFYKSINNTNSLGRMTMGYDNIWNWMNMFVNANYNYHELVSVGTTLSLDGSSASGSDTDRLGFFPSVNVTWKIANMPGVNETEWLNTANLRVEYVSTGNSRFDSKLSKYYYQNKVFRQLSTLVAGSVPSTELSWETNRTFDAGVDLSFLNNRINVTGDFYHTRISDMIVPYSISAAFGRNFLYRNAGEAKNQGFELSLRFIPVMNRDFTWQVGATFNKNKNKVTKLPGNAPVLTEFNDGATVATQVGAPMFSFYGFQTQGVFATAEAAEQANLSTPSGVKFGAGDVIFVDQDNNGVINDKDRVLLGSAAPDFYGNIFTTFRYKALTFSATFSYSKGNKMYNGVRRSMESVSDYSNQYASVRSRWSQEGMITDMPKAAYKDPMQNNRFSDRWIEDASYFKLKELMVSYRFNVLNGITVYAAGENLFTITDYLGFDPETVYSYDAVTEGFDYAKAALPRTLKLGVKLEF